MFLVFQLLLASLLLLTPLVLPGSLPLLLVRDVLGILLCWPPFCCNTPVVDSVLPLLLFSEGGRSANTYVAQNANLQIFVLKRFDRFANLSQLVHFADLRFADPIFFVMYGVKTFRK